jgi:hypothetical protein
MIVVLMEYHIIVDDHILNEMLINYEVQHIQMDIRQQVGNKWKIQKNLLLVSGDVIQKVDMSEVEVHVC